MIEMDPEDVIFFWRINDDYGEFSQWYRSEFICEDLMFSTAEQYMMYKKATIFGDNKIADMILNSSRAHPGEHKRMGRMVANFDDNTKMNPEPHVFEELDVVNDSFYDFVMRIIIHSVYKNL